MKIRFKGTKSTKQFRKLHYLVAHLRGGSRSDTKRAHIRLAEGCMGRLKSTLSGALPRESNRPDGCQNLGQNRCLEDCNPERLANTKKSHHCD